MGVQPIRRWTSAETSRSRRRFVQGLGVGVGVGAVASALPTWARAQSPRHEAGPQQVLSGTEFDLRIGTTPVNYTGASRSAVTVNGSIPAPALRWREGTTVALRVTNTLPVTSSIHWHGILLPFQMDGVPGISFPGIKPGETFVYRFPVKQNGTFWYHSHSAFQEQQGLYGPLVIDPPGADPIASDRDYTVMLSDWTDEDPERLFAKLKVMPDYYNFQQPTAIGFFRDVDQMGLAAALDKRRMWNRMRMVPTDLVDVTAATYTYLVNGATPSANWTAVAKAGERVRLRIINGSANSIFDVRIPGLPMTVVSADGQRVQPVAVDEFRVSTAETYDVIVTLPEDRAYTIFAQSIDRSGYARATLAPQAGMQAEVPPLDPKIWLTMADMGMGGMSGGGMGGMSGMNGDNMKMGGMGKDAMPGMSQGAMPGMKMEGMDKGAMSGMNHDTMPGMKMDEMGKEAMPGMNHDAMPGMKMDGTGKGGMPGMSQGDAMSKQGGGMSGSGMKGMEGKPGMEGMEGMQDMSDMAAKMRMNTGVSVDMRAVSPSTSRSDPGPRLRGNGRKVLTYSDLHTIDGPLDRRQPGRDIKLHLTGNMERFIWGFDGKKFSEAEPIKLNFGERVRIVLTNDTMMTHPIHLHGMFSEVEDEQGGFLVRKHTVNVNPGSRISYQVTADAPGQWAFHCHLLYHMEAGMFRKVVVA